MMSQQKTPVNYSELQLSDVLIDIEKTFKVKFSFNSDIVNNRLITFQIEEASLEEILSALEAQASINFTKVSNRYYIIKKQSNINLSNTQHLEEVLIKEYITSGIRKKSDDASISLSPKALGIIPGLTEPDVLQSIQLIPGVQSPTETASGLYIRGGTPDQNLILWDGIKMYHSGHFFGTISAFNPYITEEIKLYKNGTKARYGNRISGVIDIASDNNIPETLEGGMGFNMTHADAYLKTPLNQNAVIMASARRSITDAFNTETFKNLSKRVFQETKISNGNVLQEGDEVTTTKDLFYFTDFTLKAILKPSPNNKISVSSLFTKNKLDYGFLIEEFDEASQDKLDIENQGASLNWSHNYSNVFSHALSVYYSNYDLEYVGFNSIPDEFSDQLSKSNVIEDLGFSFDTDWSLNESSSLGFGYQFSSNKVNFKLAFEDSEAPEDNYNESNEETNNLHAVYSDFKLKKADRWLLNLGIRANYFSVLDKAFVEPRIQFESKLYKNLKFKASVEILHQAVSQVLEFNTQEFGLENQIWVLSDGNEAPLLKSFQLTSGFIFNKNGWNIDIEGYYKKIEGLTSLTLGFDNIGQLFSEGKSDVIGLDVLINKKIKDYRTWLSYSITENEFTFNNINGGNSFSGNSDITHHLTWSHTYDWKNFNVSLGWNIRTGIPYTKANGITDTTEGFVIDFDKTNGSRLPDYHRLDISTTYKFNLSENSKWKGKIGLSLLNIYNRENILSRTYEIRQGAASDAERLREINKSSLGITPNLVFRVEF
ncbi:TonB-dependent receptor domain-containing protein [Mariniflexile sp. HNIBRBA6329]|uniref:TonB-dependent receptor domain-containing protein n=1 Tax=Mariniflexile sp. HNIBRBA6329 TaxID=3373088 RepID=UPI003745430C